MQALRCFSVLAYENAQVSMSLVNGKASTSEPCCFCPLFLQLSACCCLVVIDGEQLPQVFVRMMQRDQPIEMQLTAAKW